MERISDIVDTLVIIKVITCRYHMSSVIFAKLTYFFQEKYYMQYKMSLTYILGHYIQEWHQCFYVLQVGNSLHKRKHFLQFNKKQVFLSDIAQMASKAGFYYSDKTKNSNIIHNTLEVYSCRIRFIRLIILEHSRALCYV